MKLHLPKMLCAAVLAAVCGTAMAATEYDGVTYSGYIFNLKATASRTYHDATFANYYQNGEGQWVESTSWSGGGSSYYIGNAATATNTSDSLPFWRWGFGNGAGNHQTVRLSGATDTVYFQTQFDPFTIGGMIVEPGTGSYVIGRHEKGCAITLQAESGQSVNMTIGADTTLSVGANAPTFTIANGGTWNVAEGKTLTFGRLTSASDLTQITNATNFNVNANQTINVDGKGTVNIKSANTTLNKGASFNIGATSTLNLTGTVNVLSDNVVESDIPTDSNGYSQVDGSATAVTIAEGGTLNADDVTWQLNGLAASYSNGVVILSGESSKYYVNVDADMGTKLAAKTSDVTIRNGATLNITGHTGNAEGMLKGNVVVEEGSTLKLSANDALGWSDGNNVKKLTVESGATVILNHGQNETFGGTLVLNGTLEGNAGSKWDMHSNSTLSVDANASATISVGQLRLRRSDTVFTMGAGSTLDISSQIVNAAGGNGVLTVNGNGTLNLTGGANITNLTLRKGGVNNISDTAATFTKFYLGGGTTNVNTTVNAGQVRLDENGGATLNINEGAVLNITGTNNTHTTDASLMLNHWGHTGTMVLNGGTLNAGSVDMHLSWDGTGVFQANAGTAKVQGISAWTHQDDQCRGKILLGSATEGSAKLIIGENGISDFADQAVLKLGNGTLGASADWSLSYNTSHTESKAEFIATTETGTIIDTTLDGTENTGATITFKNSTTGVGNMTVKGAGTLVLEGGSDRTGNTTLDSGTLLAKNATALGTGAVTVNDGATLAAADGVSMTINTLTLNGGTIQLGSDDAGTLTSSALTVNGTSTINANLVIADNGTMTFTEGTVTLGCTIDFGTGTTIALGEAYHTQLETDGMALIFTGVDDVTGLENVVVTGAFVPGHLVKVQQTDGSYNIYATPEPATATLSLLALAGLMARRRRH